MNYNWKKIWNKKRGNIKEFKSLDEADRVLYLKEIDGFDSVSDYCLLTGEALEKQHKKMKERLCYGRVKPVESVYEVGCGCGAALYQFERDGCKTGGVDYAEGLIDMAKEVLSSTDLFCGEAIDLPVKPQYDCVFSNSVFSYFPSPEYAESVLEKMLNKCNYSIGLLDIHNIEKKEQFLAYRRSIIVDYDEKYRGLDKLFYTQQFFMSFATKHNLDIFFCQSDLEGYWNNPFLFNCFMYKRS